MTGSTTKVRGADSCGQVTQRSVLVMEPAFPAPDRGCYRRLTPQISVLPRPPSASRWGPYRSLPRSSRPASIARFASRRQRADLPHRLQKLPLLIRVERHGGVRSPTFETSPETTLDPSARRPLLARISHQVTKRGRGDVRTSACCASLLRIRKANASQGAQYP